jgi:hypothetical protein
MDFNLLYDVFERTKAEGHQTRWNMFKPRVSQVRGELIENVNNWSQVTYESLGREINTDHRKYLGIYLHGLTYYNYERNEPPLAVLVVTEETRRPGDGFYEQAEELGIYDPAVETEDEAFERLSHEVFQFY